MGTASELASKMREKLEYVRLFFSVMLVKLVTLLTQSSTFHTRKILKSIPPFLCICRAINKHTVPTAIPLPTCLVLRVETNPGIFKVLLEELKEQISLLVFFCF